MAQRREAKGRLQRKGNFLSLRRRCRSKRQSELCPEGEESLSLCYGEGRLTEIFRVPAGKRRKMAQEERTRAAETARKGPERSHGQRAEENTAHGFFFLPVPLSPSPRPTIKLFTTEIWNQGSLLEQAMGSSQGQGHIGIHRKWDHNDQGRWSGLHQGVASMKWILMEAQTWTAHR